MLKRAPNGLPEVKRDGVNVEAGNVTSLWFLGGWGCSNDRARDTQTARLTFSSP